MEKAKAAVFMGAGKPFEIREFPLTKPEKGMAKIELQASGICGTDIHFHKGKLGIDPPKIIGHEFVGTIREVGEGSNTDLKNGDNVIVNIAVPCGECTLCKNGDDANCINMGVTNGGDINVAPHLYGGYAEFNYSPVTNLVPIPKGLDLEAVCAFACPGPTAIHAFSLAKKANAEISVDTAVVQGLGPVGIFAVMYLKAAGVRHIIALNGPYSDKKERMALSAGADIVMSTVKDGEDKIEEYIRSKTGGLGADLVFEGSGAISAVPFGLKILRNRGLYLVPGQYSNSGGVDILPQLITFKALHIIGSSQYSMSDVYAYLDFLVKNPNLTPAIKGMIQKFSLEDVNLAFSDTAADNIVKRILVK